MQSPLDRWFVEKILIHEEALLRYLRRSWPHRDEVHDLRQEIYARVYEAAGKAPPNQPKDFLFASARHLLADRARRAKVVSIEPMGDFDPSHVLIDDVTPERWCGGRQALKRLADAFDHLPDRCRDVVWLRRVEELSQKDVAARLGISEKTVEKQIAKGMRLLAGHLFGGEGARREAQSAAKEPDNERQRAD
ncbi:MAG: sigma-70 family RNA polymerase sigma factor [Xanthomonadales bacterium]|nr:sigma-70 family RNA polymerase sigma factor [Xanthomonadales bacterium]MBK7143916.1 sigma-70 family RNA polymerase sigma factor [Xanthomonadales bacterium]MCC6560598.1 sigma-70 family RNA polymerase sigma factor [Xanthomonadales bacterium]